jgi:hypothetical protein
MTLNPPTQTVIPISVKSADGYGSKASAATATPTARIPSWSSGQRRADARAAGDSERNDRGRLATQTDHLVGTRITRRLWGHGDPRPYRSVGHVARAG